MNIQQPTPEETMDPSPTPTPNNHILIIRYLESGSLVLFQGESQEKVKDLAKKYMQKEVCEYIFNHFVYFENDGSIVDLEDFQSLHEFLVGCGELEVLDNSFITVVRGEQ